MKAGIEIIDLLKFKYEISENSNIYSLGNSSTFNEFNCSLKMPVFSLSYGVLSHTVKKNRSHRIYSNYIFKILVALTNVHFLKTVILF